MSEYSPEVSHLTIERQEKALVIDELATPEESPPATEDGDDDGRLKGTKLLVLVCSLMLGMFMVALDSQIIATAIPRISTEFDSIDDISWYGSAYLLTQISFQPSFGRVCTFFNVKYTYLSALVFFEIGSVVCATASSSRIFIVGRAICGLGTAAVFAADQNILVHSVTLRKRPIAMAFVGSMFGVASVMSPPIGGLITDTPGLGWRFCFWINMPLGAITAVIIMWTYTPPVSDNYALPLMEKLTKLDFPGATFLIGSVMCLLLALQWGGSVYPWSNPKVWGCLVGFVLILGIFIGSQWINQERATIPYRIISQRSVLFCCLFILGVQMSIMIQTFYMPIWFQAVDGTSASVSGIHTFPYGVTTICAQLTTGYLISRTGYYVPLMWLGSAIFTIGAGSLYTLAPGSPIGQWLSIEIVAGLGFGISTQIAFFPAQNVLPGEDISTGISLVIFSQGLGGAIGLSIAANIFNDMLKERLEGIPGLDVSVLLGAGASAAGVRDATPAELLPSVLQIYNGVLLNIFLLATAAAGLGFVFSLGMERRKIGQ